jgi:hypothetical protein
MLNVKININLKIINSAINCICIVFQTFIIPSTTQNADYVNFTEDLIFHFPEFDFHPSIIREKNGVPDFDLHLVQAS